MQLTLTLNDAQSAAVIALANQTGLAHEQVVLEAIDLLSLREKFGMDGYTALMTGLAEDAAGSYADDEEVAAVFAKYGAIK